ncbi:MAG: hypothetical protein GY754_41430 [bacterium]|nr:hypothetical protein [bacterium]
MKNLDQITEMFYILLDKAHKGNLSWEPSFEALFGFFLDSIDQLYEDEFGKHTSDEINFPMDHEKFPQKFQELFQILSENKTDLKLIDKEHIDKRRVYEYEDFPDSFDWRNYNGKNFVTKIKNQGFCEACAAFAVTAAMESMFHIRNNLPVTDPAKGMDLSEQHLFFYNPNALEGTCKPQNGWHDGENKALEYCSKNGILQTAFFCKYNPYSPDYRPPLKELPENWEEHAYTVTDYKVIVNIHDDNEDMKKKMKSVISRHSPIICQMKIGSDFFLYKKGLYIGTNFQNIYTEKFELERFEGYHSVICVGYDEDGWLCKNSWGNKWGNDGYFRIKYGECEVEDMVWYIEGVEKNKIIPK